MKKRLKFGIISGGGPAVGLYMMQKVVRKLQYRGAWHDHEFPEFILHNVPFEEMLVTDCNDFKLGIAEQIQKSAVNLLKNGCDYIILTCQTAHAYVLENTGNYLEFETYLEEFEEKFISLIDIAKDFIRNDDNAKDISKVHILCSKKSFNESVHKPLILECFRECIDLKYVDIDASDLLIRRILKGKKVDLIEYFYHHDINLAELMPNDCILLGCTEYSLLENQFKELNCQIIDPIEIAADKIVKLHLDNGINF